MSRSHLQTLIALLLIWMPVANATHGGTTEYSLRCTVSNWSPSNGCWTAGNNQYYSSASAACQGNDTEIDTTIQSNQYFGHLTGQPANIHCETDGYIAPPNCTGTGVTVGTGSCSGVACPAGQVFTGPGPSDCGAPPNPCDDLLGEEFTSFNQAGGDFSIGETVCDGECAATVLAHAGGSTAWGLTITPAGSGGTQQRQYTMEWTGNTCATQNIVDHFDDSGNTYTASDPNSLCVTINGVEHCYSEADFQDSVCNEKSDGSMDCQSSAPTPPQPDNGTPGEQAQPAAEIENAQGQEFNHYDSGTVGGSTNGYGEQAGEGDGTEGDGACDPLTQNCCVGDECDDVLSGGATCTAPPTCSGSPIQCFHARKLWELHCAVDKPSDANMESAANAALGNPSSGSLIPEVDEINVGNFWSPGSASTECPDDITFDLPGDFSSNYVIPISSWCNLLHTIGLLVLAAAALSAARIFFGGVT